jgi:hypothetical protein
VLALVVIVAIVVTRLIGFLGLLIFLFIAWVIMNGTDAYDILPYEILDSPLYLLYDFLASYWGFLIIIGLALLVFVTPNLRKNLVGWGKKPEEIFIMPVRRR